MALAATAMWAAARVSRFKKNAAYLTFFVCGLFVSVVTCSHFVDTLHWRVFSVVQSITSIYRLAVMRTTTTSMTSTAPGSQNTPAEKAAFYILHIVPEWISVLVLLLCNLRDVFGTGMFGDYRAKDETEGEKESKEAKKLYKSDSNAGHAVGIHDEDFGVFSKVNNLWKRKEWLGNYDVHHLYNIHFICLSHTVCLICSPTPSFMFLIDESFHLNFAGRDEMSISKMFWMHRDEYY